MRLHPILPHADEVGNREEKEELMSRLSSAVKQNRVEAPARAWTSHRVGFDAAAVDRPHVELITLIWSHKRPWTIDDRIDAAIKYRRRGV